MVEFKTRVFSESGSEIIGAEVLVYSDNGQRLGSIEIVNAEDLESLQEELNAIPDVYVSNDDLEVILTNLNDARVINATTLSGYNSSQFAKTEHEHVTSDITNFPSSLPPSSHTHGHLTNDGAIGSTAGKPVITGENGVLSAGSFGTGPGTFCQGNDERLSNSRTPTSHAHGALANDGKVNSDISSVNKVVVTDGSNNVKTISVLPGGKLGSHTHSKSQITDFSHTHDDRYYTKTNINDRFKTSQDQGRDWLTPNGSIITAYAVQLTVRNGWGFIDINADTNSVIDGGTKLAGPISSGKRPGMTLYSPVVVQTSPWTLGMISIPTEGGNAGCVVYNGATIPKNTKVRTSFSYPIKG